MADDYVKLDTWSLIRPMEGVEIVQMGYTEEHVFHRSDEPTRNVVVDSGVVAGVLAGLARGDTPEHLAYTGFLVFWTIDEVNGRDEL